MHQVVVPGVLAAFEREPQKLAWFSASVRERIIAYSCDPATRTRAAQLARSALPARNAESAISTLDACIANRQRVDAALTAALGF
jgi:hypothetical protein